MEMEQQLNTGAVVPSPVILTVMTALHTLIDSGDLTDIMALYDIRKLAENPDYVMNQAQKQRLTNIGLLQNGKLHDATRDVVLAAVSSDMPDLHSPLL